jgi:hypothetical protein
MDGEIMAEKLQPVHPSIYFFAQGGWVSGGVRCSLQSCCCAALPLRKPHVKRTATDTARISRAKARKEQFQRPFRANAQVGDDPPKAQRLTFARRT